MVNGKWLMVAGIMCVATMSHAQVTVTVPGAAKRSFAVTGFAGEASLGNQLAEALKNDLRLSGHFQLAPMTSAEFVQQGSARIERGDVVLDCVVTQQATRKVAVSKTYRGSAQNVRQAVHALADDIVLAITGQRGIAQTKIAFVVRRNSAKEIAVMDYDGHNVRQLTSDRTINVRPRWSPNGRKLVYTSYKSRFPDVLDHEIFTGSRRRIAQFPGLNTGAVFSPDGRSIALTLSKDGNPELYTMDANGGNLQRLTRTPRAESSPTWSPDGQNIAYVSDDRGSPQVYLIGREGGEPTRLTVSPSYNTEPDWSRPPAGAALPAMIAVTSRVGGRFQVGLYDSATREVRTLAADGGDCQDASWAPDGRHLVFAKTVNWRSRLYLLDALTREQIQLPAIEGDASEPAWGP
jgi:TolB protein